MDASDPLPPSASSVDSIRELELDAKRKRRRAMLILFVIVPVLALAAGGAWWVLSERAAAEQIQAAWNESSACLVGAPLGDGERASLRMRAIQLAAVHAERDKSAESRWPNRCADAVANLYEALRRHGRDGDGEAGLAARAERFAVELRKVEVMSDVSEQVDGLFEAARGRGLRAAPTALQIPTPEPAEGFTLDSLPESARITPLQYTLDSVSATPNVDAEIHVLVHDNKVDPTPILCTFGPEGNDRCRPLGGELVGKSGLRLGGSVDQGASPLVLVGREGDGGVHRSDGKFERIAALQVQSGYVSKDGYVAVAGYATESDGRFELLEQAAPGAPVTRQTVGLEAAPSGADQIHRKQILWGKLMTQVLYEDDRKPQLLAADLPTRGQAKLVEIAEANWINAQIFGCRTPETMVVGIGRTRGLITFFDGQSWSTPVELESLSAAFGCHVGEAVFTTGYGDQQRCTPAGCRYVDGVRPAFEPFKVRESFWADLGGKVLAVASTERRGGLRYRHAAGKNLDVAGGDRLLFDDHVKDGQVVADSTLLGLLLAARGRYGVLLLTTPKGVYALRFDAEGQARPASISR